MKVKAKETVYMSGENKLFIIKDKIYNLLKEENGEFYYFKSEYCDNHLVENLNKFFEIIPDKPRICEILGVELNEPFNIKDCIRNPYTLKESDYTKGYYYIVDNQSYEISKADTMRLIEHSELIVKIPKYTDEQKEVFKAFKIIGYNYIARDAEGCVLSYELKPHKAGYDSYWTCIPEHEDYRSCEIINDIFPFIK